MNLTETRGDYSLKLTLRNARILNAINDAGYTSQAAFCRENSLNHRTVNALIALRLPPVGQDGRLTAVAQGICDALCALPEDLWTDEQLWARLPRNTFEFQVGRDQVQAMLDERTMDEKFGNYGAMKLLDYLRPRERKVMEERFVQDKTFKEVGKEMGVTQERIRQIELKAMRLIRKSVQERRMQV